MAFDAMLHRVGFTGTRRGMSEAQRRQLVAVLCQLYARRLPMAEFHHGDGDGADQEAAALAVGEVGVPETGVIKHPPKAFTAKELLARNREIVDCVSVLVAAPLHDKEELRSGTWATVRYARAKGIPVVMLSRGPA